MTRVPLRVPGVVVVSALPTGAATRTPASDASTDRTGAVSALERPDHTDWTTATAGDVS